jgi:hypothetical protein
VTPTVTYTYGTSAPAIGKLTKVESSVSTTEYTSFDILGRVTGHKQTTDGNDYTKSRVGGQAYFLYDFVTIPADLMLYYRQLYGQETEVGG